jgi:predicted unusual protein kinase regulating ubiquinone biosynthesis (AarF/ABC1/UbiB family)
VLYGSPVLCRWAEEDVFETTQLLKVCHGVASALTYLHSQGICHGDVYAHNILVDRQSGHAVICDFGASYCYDATVAGRFWEAMEVRAFGLFMHDMVVRVADGIVPCIIANSSCSASGLLQQLDCLVEQCLADNAMRRPTFANIEAQLLQMLKQQDCC